jgi:hypothetical protein
MSRAVLGIVLGVLGLRFTHVVRFWIDGLHGYL